MKLKLKKLDFDAGRPVVFLNYNFSKKFNIHVGDRVEVSFNSKKIVSIVDLTKDLLKEREIFLSDEIASYLNVKPGMYVEINLLAEPLSFNLISKKMNGKSLNKEEINIIIKDIVNNALTEAEISYFVLGVYEKGMSLQETLFLTEAMCKTGHILKWNKSQVADKHSIGGIPGNRTTPILVSIAAAAGVTMPKTSSRAITSPAGTADVVETLCKVDLSSSEMKKVVEKANACLVWGGALGLAPADDKLIRVEKLLNIDPESQLIASIMSKKLAAGSKYILIDIPHGPGAKVTLSQGENLKKKFHKVAKYFKLKLKIVLTDGSQPIGNGIGPVLETLDILKVLNRENSRPLDLERKSLFLAGKILEMTGKATKGLGEKMAKEILDSGLALKKFNEIISLQGKKNDALKPAKLSHSIISSKSGRISHIDNKSINRIGRILGSPADKGAGLYLYKHKRDKITKGETLVTFYSESKPKLKEAINFFKNSKVFKITE